MRALLWVVPLLVARGASAEEADVRAELVTAINKRDVATVTKQVELPLKLKDLHFADPACARFAGKLVKIEQSELEPFVGCMATLGIKPIDRKTVFINYTYGPGAPLYLVRKANNKVVAFYSFASKSEGDAFLIEPVLFASHVQKFRREVAPSAALKKTIDASSSEFARATTEVCIDARGKITSVTANVRDEAFKAYETDVAKVVRTWTIKPFTLNGKPVSACAELSLGYPENRIGIPLDILPPPPPPPPPPSSNLGDPPPPSADGTPQNVAPTALEGYRISGEKMIVPDDMTKLEIQQSGKTRVIASLKLCLDASGTVTKVTPLKSSGYAMYDRKLMSRMQAWRYKPYLVDGKPVPVCTAVTFIYSQASAGPPAPRP